MISSLPWPSGTAKSRESGGRRGIFSPKNPFCFLAAKRPSQRETHGFLDFSETFFIKSWIFETQGIFSGWLETRDMHENDWMIGMTGCQWQNGEEKSMLPHCYFISNRRCHAYRKIVWACWCCWWACSCQQSLVVGISESWHSLLYARWCLRYRLSKE